MYDQVIVYLNSKPEAATNYFKSTVDKKTLGETVGLDRHQSL